MSLMAPGLANLTALTHLRLSGNNLSVGGAIELMHAIRNCLARLQVLEIPNNGLLDAGASFVAGVLIHATALKRIDVSENGFTAAGASAISTAIRSRVTPVQPPSTAGAPAHPPRGSDKSADVASDGSSAARGSRASGWCSALSASAAFQAMPDHEDGAGTVALRTVLSGWRSGGVAGSESPRQTFKRWLDRPEPRSKLRR